MSATDAFNVAIQQAFLPAYLGDVYRDYQNFSRVSRFVNAAISLNLVLASRAPSFNNRLEPSETIIIETCSLCQHEGVAFEATMACSEHPGETTRCFICEACFDDIADTYEWYEGSSDYTDSLDEGSDVD